MELPLPLTPIPNLIQLAIQEHKNAVALKPSLQAQIQNYKERLGKIESELFKNKPECDIDLNISPSGLRKNILKKYLTDSFYNGNVLKIARCIFNSIIFQVPGQTEYFNHYKIKYWMKLTSIGQGSFGQAYIGNIKNNMDVIIKSQKNPGDKSLFHEVFIGVFVANQLREAGNLNFSYVYGGFSCSHPVQLQKKTPVTWCDASSENFYAGYEKIPGKALSTFISRLSSLEFLNILTQLTLSLQNAFERFKFTHYDLHADNIIMREISPKQLVYKVFGTEFYLTTNAIATMIDYGFAIAVLNGDAFVSPYIYTPGFIEGPYPLSDIFTILLSCYEHAMGTNPILMSDIKKYLSFFTTQNPEDMVAVFGKYKIMKKIPPIEQFLRATPKDFFEFLVNGFGANMGFLSQTPVNPLICTDLICEPLSETVRRTLDLSKIPDDPFAFYSLFYQSNPRERSRLLADYDIDVGREIFSTKYERTKLNLVGHNVIMSPAVPELSIMQTPTFIEFYLHYLINVAYLVNSVLEMGALKQLNEFLTGNFGVTIFDYTVLESGKSELKRNLDRISEDIEIFRVNGNIPDIANLYITAKWYEDFYKIV